jgi:molybdopterin-containing oxidoreductase family iron-sulfur binding subunit
MRAQSTDPSVSRYGMAIDLDRCDGCGACMLACAVENNVAVPPLEAGERKSITPMRVQRVDAAPADAGSGAASESATDVVFVPVACQHCGEHTPCVSVCPQNAVDVDPQTGIVSQIPSRCLGCRYCMAACAYHARSFNWWDPAWPHGLEHVLNPDVAPRMRGVVEKCNFCHGRWQAARARAAAAGDRDPAPEFVPACAEACPQNAIVFGDLNDPESDVARLAHDARAFRLLPALGTDPKVVYLSERAWVRALGNEPRTVVEGKA